ncbi:MAG: putative glycoside hydrolase [Nitrospirota bacterium]
MNTYKNLILCPISIALLIIFGGWEMGAHAAAPQGFPLIMAMNIGKKNYDDPEYLAALSRPNFVILGFYPDWRGKDGKSSIEAVVQAIKKRNPAILIGQYTILSETQDSTDRTSADTDKGKKLDREGWWLLNANKKRVQWTDKYNAFEANITQWTKPDEKGLRYPEWVAHRDYGIYFRTIPGFDIWYFDNALSKPAVKTADWNRDGNNDANDNSEILRAHRSGHVAEWRKARELRPDIFLMGNSDDLSSPEFSGNLQGAFLEGLIGVSWSMERWQGWEKMMSRYHSAMIHTASPHLVGFNVWGRADDYQQMRYGLTSCLLDNGYFSYTDPNVGYSSVPWFDEFDVHLGDPVAPVQTEPWEQGIYRRVFQHGLVLVNPGALARTVRLNPGYRHFDGTQVPEVNNGKPVTSITIPSKDGIILIRMDR